jgi:hypothetical protein
MSDALSITIGEEHFRARLRRDLAPRSCERLLALLPYAAQVIHASWSGEALWSPLGAAWPVGEKLPEENAVEHPAPGQILLFAGTGSEPELLFPYGESRFACKAGALEGNPVLSIEDGLERISRIGLAVLWRGAVPISIEVSP